MAFTAKMTERHRSSSPDEHIMVVGGDSHSRGMEWVSDCYTGESGDLGERRYLRKELNCRNRK